MFKKALFASAAVMAAGVASAEVTGNFAVTSDYNFRGVSFGQAVQGGLDYAHESGLYAGTWLSNTNGNDEIDYYVGYGLGLSDGLDLDVGLIRYRFDNTAVGTIDEAYVGLAGEAWSATVYYSGVVDSDDANNLYLDLGYSMSTGETTSVDFHVGMLDPDGSGDEIIDYSVTYNVGDFSMGVSNTNDDSGATPGSDEDIDVIVSWGTSFDVK